jgi:putative ABC transport system ATP-binding protein
MQAPVQQTTEQPLIRLSNIVKTYKNSAGEFTVLKGINAQFQRGEFVGIIGKSGSGKSTLINMISGIDRPTSGEIFIGDTAVHKLSENKMSVWRGRNLGIVFQFFQLLPMLSLLENVMLPMDFCHMYSVRERKKRALELLALVDMQEHAGKLPTAISGGQQQRVAIARALANDPPILIADEPTGNLDSRTAESVFAMFGDLVQRGKTIIMVTHDSALARRVSRTLLIADGEVVNEWILKALPSLAYAEMIKASRKVQPLSFQPGQEIIHQDQPADRLYIVTHGQAEVALKRPGGSDVVVAHMNPGQYFGEIELLHGGQAIASVRAGEAGVDVAALDRETFTGLLSDSDLTKASLYHTAEQRMDENAAARMQS